MPLPEGYPPRDGDILTLTAIVERDVRPDEDQVYVKIDGRYSAVFVELDKVQGLFSKHWSAGDKVMLLDCDWSEPGEVIATFGQHVWVMSPSSSYTRDEPITYPANELTLWVDPEVLASPAVEELEAILNSEDPRPVKITPEGKVIEFSDDEGPGAVLIRNDEDDES